VVATKATNALASRGLEIKAEIAKLDNELKGINTKLVKAGAQTIELDAGRVTITAATESRPSGVYNLVFDRARFLELDPNHAARQLAISSGIIVLEQGVVAGRQSVVQYSLRSK